MLDVAYRAQVPRLPWARPMASLSHPLSNKLDVFSLASASLILAAVLAKGVSCMACDQVGWLVWNSRRALPGVLVALLACGDGAGPNPPSSNPVASILITPSSDTLILALSVQLSAVVRDSSDTPLSGYALAWASSDPTVATVSATGLVVSVGLGVATITATTAGKTGLAVLTVAPIITITPRRPSMFAGDTVGASDVQSRRPASTGVPWASIQGGRRMARRLR